MNKKYCLTFIDKQNNEEITRFLTPEKGLKGTAVVVLRVFLRPISLCFVLNMPKISNRKQCNENVDGSN